MAPKKPAKKRCAPTATVKKSSAPKKETTKKSTVEAASAPQAAQPQQSAYAAVGVDIDSKMQGIKTIKAMVKETATKGSVGGIGAFGGLFRSPGKEDLLVGSTDGVGTKLKVASLVGKHNTVGQDLVNHCVNDILVQGAKPLFFLDYIGAAHFDEKVFKEIVSGLCKACKENGCALLGGETAEMPGVYSYGEYDLVGTIVGTVPRKKVITGAKIREGDVIIGLASGGLQTNGFTLARNVLLERSGLTVKDRLPGTRQTIGEHLLAIHKSFLKPVMALEKAGVAINGMAHITGGGFVDNIPRVLPEKCDAVIDRASWTPPAIFTFIEKQGKVDHDEMYRVFNMGIGFVVIVPKAQSDKALKILSAARSQPKLIGRITKGTKKVVYEA